mgnify:FL=1
MKKKIIYLLLTIILIFSVTDVYAREITLVFLKNCKESEDAYRRWSGGKTLERSGSYTFHIPDGADMSNYPGYDDISGDIGDSSSTQGCGPVAHNKLSCSFGCLESALDAANPNAIRAENTSDIISALGNSATSTGVEFCRKICFDKKKFYAPTGSNPDVVKQGGKFTWNNEFGHILTFKDDRTCVTIFDADGWKKSYDANANKISAYNNLLNQKSYARCLQGEYDSNKGQCRIQNGYSNTSNCLKWELVSEDGKKPELKCTKYDVKPNYNYVNPDACKDGFRADGANCVMKEEYKKELIELRKGVVETLKNQISSAKSCENEGNATAIAKCDNVTISYDDEVYGRILDQSAEYRKLIASGGSTGPSLVRSKNTNLTIKLYNSCPDTDIACGPSSTSTMSFMFYKVTKIETEYHWDIKSDLFSCIDINGKSYLSCAMAADAAPNRYITVGSNFPVSFNASTGVKNISINYGCSDATNATNGDACHYNVEKCPDNICAPVDPEDPSCVGEHCDTPNPPGGSIYAIYRTIDLNNPFPNRTPGDNWNKNDNAKTYIENNRGAKTEDVYSLEPLYKIELDPAKIKEIRKDNKNVDYGSFDDLTCTNGENCKSSYLNELVGKGYLTVNGG